MNATRIAMTAVLVVTATSIAAAQKHAHRQKAHTHGTGTLNIAIEANNVSLELEVPADDILGFEHAPRTKAQKEAVARAERLLSEPISLLGIPAEAGCKVVKVAVERRGGGGGHGHDHKGKKPEGEHSEYLARFELTCAGPLAAIKPAYFKMFPRAHGLEVNAITPSGQMAGKVTSRKPVFRFAGKN